MRIKFLSVVFLFLILPAIASGEELKVKTVGNHSYISLGVYKNPDEYSIQILNILSWFERQNPDKEIVCWKIEKQQKGYSISDYIFGLWIDHRQK